MDQALETVELDCAFALFHFHGEPMHELNGHVDTGVIGWARQNHAAAMTAMVDSVETAVRTTLNTFYPAPADANPLADATSGEIDLALDDLDLNDSNDFEVTP